MVLGFEGRAGERLPGAICVCGRFKSGDFDKSGLSRGFDDGWPRDAKETPADLVIRAEAKTRAPADSVTPGRREATNPGSIFHRVLKRGSRVPRFARPRDDGRGWARLSPMRRMRTVRTKPLEPAEWAGQTSEDPAGSSGKYGECGLFNPAYSRGGCAPSAHRASVIPLLAVTPGRCAASNPGSTFHRVLRRGSRVPRFARPRDDGG